MKFYHKFLLAGLVVLALSLSHAALAVSDYAPGSNYRAQDGKDWVVQGTQEINSGGTFTAASGSTANIAGTFQIGGVTVSATAAEINKVAHDASRVVPVSGTYSASCATNGTGAINYISSNAANATITLPAATGTGCSMTYVWNNLPYGPGGTTGHDTLRVTGTDSFVGILSTLSDDTAEMKGWAAAAGSDNDQIAFNSATKFVHSAGAQLTVTDIAPGVWNIKGQGNSSGTEVTPFATGQRP